ncbi:hypothetical protein [Saccharothrix sp. Mg75]|uniref:hypothetical protein n=1 Tax=Saccharothrix sp. Mg75 TaxID=3445357 RepID=UPI003EECE2D4
MDPPPPAQNGPPVPRAGLSLSARSHGDAVLLSPTGRLDLSTYARLRDGLLKHLVDQPRAVVVGLGPELDIGSDSLTSVFVSVWTRSRPWSDTPLLLVATTAGHRSTLARNGVPRFLPCFDRLTAALDAVENPPPRQRDQAQLPLDADTEHLARDFTRRTCHRWRGLHDITPRAVLLAGELTGLARSTAASGTTLVLLLERRPAHLSITVRCVGATSTHPVTAPDLTRAQRLSTAHGTVRTPDGAVIWATIGLDRHRI